MTTWIDDDDLRLSIEMALLKIEETSQRRDDIYRKMVAEQIVAHLKRANWRFEKGPPLPSHGQSKSGG